MATQLGVYNSALRLIKNRKLSTITDDVEARYLLDDAYALAIAYCLELGQWNFATRSATITMAATPAFGYTRTGSLPSDYVRMVSVSASSAYYPPLENYAVYGSSVYANDALLYVSYVSDDASYGNSLTLWPETFTKLVEAHIAREIAPHLTSGGEDIMKGLERTFQERLQMAVAKDAINKTVRVSSTATLSLYNAALRIVGQRFVENYSDDVVASRMQPEEQSQDGSKRYSTARDPSVKLEMVLRRLLDECYDDALEYMLSQGLWNFALRSAAIDASVDTEPAFGHPFAFEKPDDFVRLNAISADEKFNPTLDDYTDEGLFWFASVSPIYVSYISDDAAYGGNVSNWPPYYKRAVEYELAHRIMGSVPGLSAAKRDEIREEREIAMRSARAKDAMNQPAQSPPPGRLVRSRGGNGALSGRPWWR